MKSETDTWTPSPEYTQLIDDAEKYSQYKLHLSTLKEQERLNTPSPAIDLFIKIIDKIKQSFKQQTR